MAKRVPPLSATKLAKFKPDAVKVLELVDGAVPGLRVRLTPAGTRSWSLNIRANGKMRRFDVGRGLGLAQKTMSNYINHVAETPVDEVFQPLIWKRGDKPLKV